MHALCWLDFSGAGYSFLGKLSELICEKSCFSFGMGIMNSGGAEFVPLAEVLDLKSFIK